MRTGNPICGNRRNLRIKVVCGGDVFTWRAGSTYSRGKYTVAGLAAGFPNAVPGTVPRVQLGHTNDLLVTTRIPTNGEGTVSFSDPTFVAGVSVKNLRTGQYDALRTSYAAAAWRAAYLSTNHTDLLTDASKILRQRAGAERGGAYPGGAYPRFSR